MIFPNVEALSDAQRIMLGWAIRETAPWRGRRVKRRYAETVFENLASRWPSVFHFHIRNGGVDMAGKTASPDDDARMPALIGRAELYRGLLQEAVNTWCPSLDTVLCVGVGDKGREHREVPLFCFQNERAAGTILLPDVDFLIHRFYAEDGQQDRLAYGDKAIHAKFVGTLTGGRITAASLRDLQMPRLAAAAHFHLDPDVTFRLPCLAQCDSDEARDMFAALPYCGGETEAWAQQWANRFIISMDGNGATCSRVALALKSNSVLLKYDSPHRLYYFDGLSPWRHFIPVSAHEEMNTVVALERQSPGLFAYVAAEGRAFAETYLTRESVVFYTAALLILYSQCLVQPRAARLDGSYASPV